VVLPWNNITNSVEGIEKYILYTYINVYENIDRVNFQA